MARSFNGTTQYLIGSNPSVTSYPLTISAWCQYSSGGLALAVSLCDASVDDDDQILFQIRESGATRFFAAASLGSSFQRADATTDIAAGGWFHGVARYGSTTDREIYTNGVSEASNTSNDGLIFANIDRLGIVCRCQSTIDSFFGGDMGDVAIWDVSLDDREIAALATGVRPNRIRRDSLVHWWPLWGVHSPEIDLMGNLDLTLTAAPTRSADAPPISTKMFWWDPSFEELAVAAGLSIPVAMYNYRRNRVI